MVWETDKINIKLKKWLEAQEKKIPENDILIYLLSVRVTWPYATHLVFFSCTHTQGMEYKEKSSDTFIQIQHIAAIGRVVTNAPGRIKQSPPATASICPSYNRVLCWFTSFFWSQSQLVLIGRISPACGPTLRGVTGLHALSTPF